MSKQEQVLIIEPQSELKFKGPFAVPVTSYMKLTNPSDKRVLFKIKTTAPKKYCVRPNSGVLEPKAGIEIAICLQPFIFDPAEKNKHKFMVQTVYAPEGDINHDALWKDICPEQLMDSKLKCVFEMPIDNTQSAVPENLVDPPEDKTKREQKSSPKIVSGMTPSQVESELEKASHEIKVLREEEKALRQQNLLLKEEIIALQKSQSSGLQSTSATISTKYNPSVQQQVSYPIMYVGAAIAIVIFGVILGKFIL